MHPTMTELQRPTLTLPDNGQRLLLHSCCAPCSGEVMEAITASGIDYAIFFYNPNIGGKATKTYPTHPKHPARRAAAD